MCLTALIALVRTLLRSLLGSSSQPLPERSSPFPGPWSPLRNPYLGCLGPPAEAAPGGVVVAETALWTRPQRGRPAAWHTALGLRGGRPPPGGGAHASGGDGRPRGPRPLSASAN